jgi:hypothetical protein
VGDFELAGTPISGVITDIDGQVRHSTFPYRGADEAEIPLPVELASFAASVSGNSVSLSWTTISEKNNHGFEVERSTIEDPWETAGFIGGKGTTTEINHYSFTDENLSAGKYNYRLKQIDLDGSFNYFKLAELVEIGTPAKYELSQNYPNPFNPSTTIRYSLAKESEVTLKIYDLLGREVASLVNEKQNAGNYQVEFSTLNGIQNISSGIYFYTIKAGSFIQTMKMMIIK